MRRVVGSKDDYEKALAEATAAHARYVESVYGLARPEDIRQPNCVVPVENGDRLYFRKEWLHLPGGFSVCFWRLDK